MGTIEELERRVEHLSQVHDFFFPVSLTEKQEVMTALIADAVDYARTIKEDGVDKAGTARVACLLGRTLDAQGPYSSAAEEHLERSLKLDPSNAEAWHALAHVKFKKGDIANAKACIDTALARKPDDVKSLQLASMLLRQLKGPGVDTVASVRESIRLASAAVKCDVTNPFSWTLLGNAHLMDFFVSDHSLDKLQGARKALNKASSLEAGMGAATSATATAAATDVGATKPADLRPVKRYPDAHYNKGVVCMYLEDYDEAVACFGQAASVDPAMANDARLELIVSHVRRTSEAIERKCGLKGKRLREACDALAKHTTPAPPAVIGDRNRVPLSALADGGNAGAFVALTPLAPVPRGDNPPAVVVMMDEEGTCVSVAIYHLSEGSASRLVAKDKVVVLLDPFVKQVRYRGPAPADTAAAAAAAGESASAGTTEYRALHVLQPGQLVVNGVVSKATGLQAEMRLTAFDG